MLTKISKLHLSYSTKSCRHTLSPNEKILRHIYFFVAFCDNGDRQREPCIKRHLCRKLNQIKNVKIIVRQIYDGILTFLVITFLF